MIWKWQSGKGRQRIEPCGIKHLEVSRILSHNHRRKWSVGCQRLGEGEMGSQFNGCSLFYKMKRVLEMESGEGCTLCI